MFVRTQYRGVIVRNLGDKFCSTDPNSRLAYPPCLERKRLAGPIQHGSSGFERLQSVQEHLGIRFGIHVNSF